MRLLTFFQIVGSVSHVPVEVNFDLKNVRGDGSTEGEIVVTGPRTNEQRATKDEKPEPVLLPKAEVRLGQTRIGIATKHQAIGGMPSNRIMLTVRASF